MPGQHEMSNPGIQDGTAGAAPRRERRRCSRRKILDRGETVHVELGPTESALLLDVSAKGISVQGRKPLMPGLRLSLRFQLPDSQITVQPTYEVVWAEKNGRIGLKFLYMAEREQRQLEQWLTARAADSPDLPAVTGPVLITPLVEESTNETPPAPSAAAPVPSPAPVPQGDTGAAQPQTGGEGPGATDNGLVTLELDEALARLVQQACSMTQADGAALAIRSEQGVICRASVGNAPDVGMQMNPSSGLSGECFRTGAVVICTDAADDSRVDPAIARQLNLRSILIVPIHVGDATVGLVEVLSSQPSAFNATHLSKLSPVVELAGVLLDGSSAVPAAQVREPEVREEEVLSLDEENFPAARAEVLGSLDSLDIETPVPAKEPQRADDAGVADIIELLGPELAELRLAERKGLDPELRVPTFLGMEPELPHQRTDLASKISAAVAGRTAPAIPVAARLLKAMPALRNRNVVLIASGCVLLVALVLWAVLGGWFRSRVPNAVPQSTRATAPPAVTVPAPTATTAAAPPASSPVSRQNAGQQRSAEAQKASSGSDSEEQFPTVVRWVPADAPAKTSNGDAAPNVPPPLPDAGSTAAAMPRLAADVATPVPAPAVPAGSAPSGPLRVAAEVMRRRLVSNPPPGYPNFARQTRMEGDVVLDVRVAPNGSVRSIRIVSGPQVLAQAAIDAVSRWRYQPYILQGKAIEVDTTVAVRFSLPRR